MPTVLTVSMIGNGEYLAAALGGAGRGSRVARQALNDSTRLNKGWLMLDVTFSAESSLCVSFRSLFSSCVRNHRATVSSVCLKV
jgi:hypothetical protein